MTIPEPTAYELHEIALQLQEAERDLAKENLAQSIQQASNEETVAELRVFYNRKHEEREAAVHQDQIQSLNDGLIRALSEKNVAEGKLQRANVLTWIFAGVAVVACLWRWWR